jgi:hypothetical protein
MKRLLSPLAVALVVVAVGEIPGVIAASRIGGTSLVRTAGGALTAENDRDVTIPAGTRLRVRLNSSISSSASRVEQPVDATVIAAVRIGQTEALPVGSHVKGDVTVAERSGKVKGRARLAVAFRTLTVAGGASYPITAQYSRIAPATKGEDAAKIGIPAAGGAIVGGLIGGKKGAAEGAAVGGGAGTAVVLSTRGKEVRLPRGSVLSLRLQHSVTVRVPVK